MSLATPSDDGRKAGRWSKVERVQAEIISETHTSCAPLSFLRLTTTFVSNYLDTTRYSFPQSGSLKARCVPSVVERGRYG